MIGYDHTNNDSKSVIQCTGSLGFAFINVNTLKIARLSFTSCGAHFPWQVTVEEKFLFPDDFKTQIRLRKMPVTFYFLQTTNVAISNVAISNTKGAGLVGINMLGLSNISQSTFSGNTPNCLLLFLNSPSASDVISPNIFNITHSQMMFGKLTNVLKKHNPWGATGLNIMLAQTTYKVHIYIDNIKSYSNMNKNKWYGNLRFYLENWECSCSMIQVKNITSTNMIRRMDEILVRLESRLNSSLPCKCTKPGEEEYTVSISDSYFAGVGIRVDTNYKYCYARIKLQNITVQDSTAQALHITGMKSIKVKDMKFTNTTGIRIEDSNIIASGRCQFIHNTGNMSIAGFFRSIISFHGDVEFIENMVQRIAVIIANNSTITFNQTAEIVGNKGRLGGAIGLFDDSQLFWGNQSNTTFLRNYAQQNGGAILIDGSIMNVESEAKVEFTENEAYNGGALAFQNDARINLKPHSQIIFKNNSARQYGGALYVEEPTLKFSSYFNIQRVKCFIQPPEELSSQAMMFSNNTAVSAGSSLYGGWVDLCTISTGTSIPSNKVLPHSEALSQPSPVSSNPTRVCMCISNLPDCSITEHNITVYPGQTFQIPAVAVGQMFGTVPFSVHSRFSRINSGSPPQIKELQRIQRVRGTCTNLIYTIAPSNLPEEMELTVDKLDKLPVEYIAQYPDKNKLPLVLRDLHLHIHLNTCPLGFMLNTSGCICDKQLTLRGINCNIDTQKVYRQSSKWINATLINTSQYGVLVHNHCPFDYCKPESFDLDLEDPDEQCAFNRSGILCGACQHLSHVFGTSACRECSSLWTLLWVPVIALAGIALVVLLIALNLTVSVGTVNGLIFYANIVRANHATFFPPNTTNSFLSWFIAWINLDLGIETCFYNGLDAYVKTWLQFAFPLYIWLIVVLIIVFSHYFDKIARLSGSNAVPVLATLFLLSYAKLLRIIITVFQSTELEYSDKFVRKVWLYDGNVNYLEGKHIPLFVAAVVLLLAISVPYTGMLLFIQCFQKLSNHKLLSWIHKLKPLFDAYTGPYKDRHRYWTGLLLLVRVALFVIVSVNAIANPAVDLLAITLTTFCLITHGVVAGQVYKTWILNAIEYSYFLNLGVLSCATFYTRASDQEASRGATGQDQKAVVYTSVAIALVTFIVIVMMHMVKKVKSFPQFNRIFSERVNSKLSTLRGRATLAMRRKRPHSPPPSPVVSPTSIQLRESLLEYCVND